MTMSPFERWSVWLTTAGTLITGVAYWWMDTLLTPADPWAVINHPLQPWMLKAHILIAPLLVFSVGLITSRHIWRHFRSGVGRGRTTGILAAASFIALVLSGYVLQVLTTEALLTILAWTHLVLGLVYSIGVGMHWPATRRGSTAPRPRSMARVRRPLGPGGEPGTRPPPDARRRHHHTGSSSAARGGRSD